MRIILIGPPGSGKGTQAHFISQHYNLPHLSTGDMLRSIILERSPLGKDIEAIINNGQLVTDEMMKQLVLTRIKQNDCQKGFILDGFPRTIAQTTILSTITPIDLILEFSLSDQIVIERFGGRRIHPASGRIYHLRYHPPQIANRDDITGEPLIQRPDDTEKVIKKRLEIYHQHAKPVISYYQQLAKETNLRYHTLSCTDPIDIINHRIQSIIEGAV